MDSFKKKIIQYFSDEFPEYIDSSQDTISTIPTNNQTTIESSNTQTTPISTENQTKDQTMAKKTPTPEIISPPPIPNDPELLQLYNECLSCKLCSLCESAANLVFGDGNPQADLMLIGEAPGADEDAQGKPFVGRAGQLLISILNQYGVNREDIFIANILKHRPPNNRNPLPTEITACTPYLQKQIALIKPKLLITLGNFSSQYILNTKTGITKIRGEIQESSYGMVMPTLHPSAIIRGAYPVHHLESDIIKALRYIGHEIEEK